LNIRKATQEKNGSANVNNEWMKINSDSTFNGGFHGCTAGYAIGSATQVALTGFGSTF
jgi:hypothetical protein